jgi:hypothetical protein
MMKRTTIFMPEELERDLYAYAKRSGRPAASIVRESIAAYIVEGPHAQTLPSFVGAFDSGHTDTADRHDELLFERLTPHGAQPASSKVRVSRRSPARSASRSRNRS